MPPPPLTTIRQHCPLCGPEAISTGVGSGWDFEYGTTREEFRMLRCSGCDLVFLKGRPADHHHADIYPASYHAFSFDEEQFGIIHRVRRRLEAARLLSVCNGLPPDARIIDIGCGDGFHIGLLREFGSPTWALEGIDLDPRAVAVATSRGLPVRQASAADLDLEEASYDLALLIMTIEHVAHPDVLLREIARILRPGGQLLVITDNTSTVDFALFHPRHWGGYHFPRHWNLFNPSNLRQIGIAAGFSTASVRTQMSPVNWVYSIHNILAEAGSPQRLQDFFSLSSPVALAAFSAVDSAATALGMGAVLRGSFTR